MLEHAHRATDPQRIIPSLSAAAVSLLLLEKPGEARAAAEEMIALARAKGRLRDVRGDCAALRRRGGDRGGRRAEGEAEIERALGFYRSVGAGFLVRRAEAEAYSDSA